jgi:non-ribosomal peptide synthetase component F
LRRVRGDALGAFDHQDLQFELLVQELAPPRDLSRNPLAQVLFQVVQAHDSRSVAAPDLHLAGGAAEPFHLDLVTTRADVEMHLVEHTDGRWTGLLIYSTDLFDDSTMRRFWDSYVRVLERVAADPNVHLSQLDTTRHHGAEHAARPIGAGRSSGTPRNATEQVIAQIWAEVLDLPAVGVYDDLTGLGSDASVAAEVARRVSLHFRANVDSGVVLGYPTIAEFVAASHKWAAASSE